MLRFAASRDGSGAAPDAVTRLLVRLDETRITGTLTLAGSEQGKAHIEREVIPLAESWQAALAGLPSDWSDVLGEIELLSSDYIERASVLCIQMNPRRDGNRSALLFRAARTAGYGVSPQMATRCLERCDAEQIRVSVTVLRSLSDTRHVGTQGPVWNIARKTV